MLKNNTSIFILLGILIAIAIGLQFIGKKTNKINKIIHAVPEDAAIIMETNSFADLIYKFNNENLMKTEFAEIVNWKSFFYKINYFDSIFSKEGNINNLFTDNNIIISSHFSGKKNIDLLFLIPLKNTKNTDIIKNFISKQIFQKGTIKQRSYENSSIFDVEFLNDEEKINNFHYYFTKNAFIISFSKILLEKSVRKIQHKKSILNNKAFNALSSTTGKNVDANIYVNYSFFHRILSTFTLSDFTPNIEFFNNFASWSALDLKLKNNAVLLSGFTYANDSLNHYLSTFKNQEPIDNEFVRVLPNNTSAFIALNFSDIKSWQKRYIKYLKKYGDYKSFIAKQKKYRNNAKIKDFFYNNIEGNVSIAWVNKSISEGKNDIVGVFQLEDPKKLQEKLKNLIAVDSLDNIAVLKKTIIDKEKNILVKRFLLPQIFSNMFGKIFLNLEASYYYFADDYIVFAKSPQILKSFYKKYKFNSNLENDVDYQNYSKSISSKSNIFVYSNFTYSKPIIESLLNKTSKKLYKENIKKFNNLQAFTAQFASSKDFVFSSIYLNYNPLYKRKNKYVWQINLENVLHKKPQIVLNHNTGNNETVFQDVNNTLYLVSETGKVLWKKHINEKILGEIHQVDFYKNNKLQLMFNTKNKIYLIDRNGKDVENYPIKFKSPATNPVAVFDYKNNKDYRILVACENKNIYLLDKSANKIEGWAFEKTQTNVTQIAQHFVNDNKDYIVFSDNKKTYIVNRRGEIRVKPEYDFIRNKNTKFYFEKGTTKKDARFVCTDTKGIVHFIFTDGSMKKMNISNFSQNHKFAYIDLLGNGSKYFVYTDNKKLKVFNRDKTLRFEHEFSVNINNSIAFYKFSKGIRYIGVTEQSKNKIYLFNPNGKLVKGFPMNGCSPFTISQINKKSKTLSIIVGSSNKNLYNYSFNKK